MIVDMSAVLAILFREPECARLEAALVSEPQPHMSAGTLLETAIVVEVRRSGG